MTAFWSARRATAVFVLGVALAACYGDISAQSAATAPDAAQSTSTPPSSTPVVTGRGAMLPDFATLVERYGGAVVNVEVVQVTVTVTAPPGPP